MISDAQNYNDNNGNSSLIGCGIGIAFPGGESDSELNASLVYLFYKPLTTGVSVEAQGVAAISIAPSYGDGSLYFQLIHASF